MKDSIPLPDFTKGSVLVVGDAILDKYCYGTADRVSPEAPVQVVNVGEEMDRLGGAANVAANISALNAQATLIGLVGADEEAKRLTNLLDKNNITHQMIVVKDSPTIIKSRVISHNQQLLRLDYEDGFPGAPLDEVEAVFKHRVDDADVVLFSDYAKGCLGNIERLIAIARSAGKLIFVDPKRADFSAYSGATVLTPNRKEFTVAVGEHQTQDEFENKAMELCNRCNLDALLVTLGNGGMTLFEKGQHSVHYAAEVREVYDTTGAGDTVISVLASAVAAGADLAPATKLANKAAGISVMKVGTTVVKLEELAAVNHAGGGQSGICQANELLANLQLARDQGELVVMTNGCFDLLHLGHINYLQQASRLGTILVVAVNDDKSVTKLKGATRPIKSLEERMMILDALKMVDWVVPFSEETPADLIAKIQPDVLVKGGDYKPEEVVGYEAVTANGGKVVVLDYIDGYSTSTTIQKIQAIRH